MKRPAGCYAARLAQLRPAGADAASGRQPASTLLIARRARAGRARIGETAANSRLPLPRQDL
jgi:hypothetical protein